MQVGRNDDGPVIKVEIVNRTPLFLEVFNHITYR